MSQRINNIRARYHAEMSAAVKKVQNESINEAIQTLIELQEMHGCDALYEVIGFTSGSLIEGLEALQARYTS